MKKSQLKQIIKEEFQKVLKEIESKEILSKDEIKKIAQYDLKFQSDEYSSESSYFNDEDLRNKYLDVLNNPTLNTLIEAIFTSLPIHYGGDDIYSDSEFLLLMDEFMMVSAENTLGEKRFEEIKPDLRKYTEQYSKILKKKYLAS
jgi:hypothetical protein